MIRQLRYAGERRVFALVCPDLDDPSLYRVHWRDGEVSECFASVTDACELARREAVRHCVVWPRDRSGRLKPNAHGWYWELVGRGDADSRALASAAKMKGLWYQA